MRREDSGVKTVALVIPWFGADLKGGAEQQAFQIATRLAARGHTVEVLTTCCRSFQDDWSINHYPPGASAESGVIVRRFPVETARDAARFDEVNSRLLQLRPEDLRPGVNPVTDEDARVFADENINSTQLLSFLDQRREQYRAFIFLPYMFGLVVKGLPLVADRAFLQSCLHDEPQAYFPHTAELFRRARRLLFNSEGERQLALRLYGPGVVRRSVVVGEGVEPGKFSPEQLAAALPDELRGAPFVLYLGRRDPTKNINLLARAFKSFKAASPHTSLRLVLAGPGERSFNAPATGLFDLGLVAEELKWSLLDAARALFQPSRNESFSRAMMEAWSAGRPVAAHRHCLATATAIEASGGGWLATEEAEWTKLFSLIASAKESELHEVGARGRRYATQHADWERVIDHYEEALDLERQRRNGVETVETTFAGETAGVESRASIHHSSLVTRHSSSSFTAVHQLLPDLVYGDAIGNQAVALREQLRDADYESEIFVKRVEARIAHEARLVDEARIDPAAVVLYHHSIGSEVTAQAVAHRGPKCLIYHNVTPAEFFAAYRPGFAWMLENGRAQLPGLARHFPVSVGDSAFNAAELAACGFASPGVLPIIVNPDKWNLQPDAKLMDQLQDGVTNILFVGRVAPNKRQDRLVEAFARYLSLDAGARLVLAGDGQAFDPYCQRVLSLIGQLKISERVLIAGRLSDEELLACYRTAHLYWSWSEHEGFGVPLVEAMWHDVPVLARGGTATTETMGGAGVLFDGTDDVQQVVAHARRLVHDPELRQAVLIKQRARRSAFTPEAVRERLFEIVSKLETNLRRREVA